MDKVQRNYVLYFIKIQIVSNLKYIPDDWQLLRRSEAEGVCVLTDLVVLNKSGKGALCPSGVT